MRGTFPLLDLPSQALAVQQLLKGLAAEEKLAWMTAHGGLSRVKMFYPDCQPIYRFVSYIGMECVFFVDGDEFAFICDHTTYIAKERDPN